MYRWMLLFPLCILNGSSRRALAVSSNVVATVARRILVAPPEVEHLPE
jgi:hypothetical protein